MREKDKEVELVKELIRATEEGRIPWRPTAKIDEFTSSFRGHFSVLVSKEVQGEYHFRIMDEDDRELLHLFGRKLGDSPSLSNPMTNSTGNVSLASLLGWPGELLAKLFELARRSGLKIDKAIDEILQGLKSA